MKANEYLVAGGDEHGNEPHTVTACLENCPSCGTLEKVGVQNTSMDDISFGVICYPCQWQVNGDTVQEAIGNWNRRPSSPPSGEEREDAVFAKGYRVGFYAGTGGTTAFNDEVADAHTQWHRNGRKTHLDAPYQPQQEGGQTDDSD